MESALVFCKVRLALIHIFPDVQGAPEAEAFNDQAVSENVSISKSLNIIKQNKNLDFLCDWKNPAKAAFRRVVIDIVLATEMTRYGAINCHCCEAR